MASVASSTAPLVVEKDKEKEKEAMESSAPKTYGDLLRGAEPPRLPDYFLSTRMILYTCVCGRMRAYAPVHTRCGCCVYRIGSYCCKGCAEHNARKVASEQLALAGGKDSAEKVGVEKVVHSPTCGGEDDLLNLDISSCCDTQGDLVPTVDDVLVLSVQHRDSCVLNTKCANKRDHLLDAGVHFNPDGIAYGNAESPVASKGE